MPTYKLYHKIGNWKLESVLSKNWIEIKTTNEFDSSTSQKIKQLNEKLEEPTISQIEPDLIEFGYKNKIRIAGQTIPVPEKFHVISFKDMLAIQVIPSKASFLLEKALQNKMSILLFSDKELVKIYRKLKSAEKDSQINLIVHRIIVESTMIESDPVKELNISAKDVAELELFNGILVNSKRVRALTLKVRGIAEKPLTVRFGANQILIYGDHEKDTIINFLSLLIKT